MWVIQQFGSLLNLSLCEEYSSMPRARTPRNGKAKSQAVASVSQITVSPEVEIKTNGDSLDLEAEIRRRAYELYEQRGRTPGHEGEDWVVAEREIVARYHQGA
jgi:hypothetical protein